MPKPLPRLKSRRKDRRLLMKSGSGRRMQSISQRSRRIMSLKNRMMAKSRQVKNRRKPIRE